MCALAHVIEKAGIATVTLASTLAVAEKMEPPRAMWADFPLGRPLGKPGDPEFQHRVLAAAFALLDSPEPVVTEFDEAIRDDGDEMLACPLPPRHDPDAHPAIDEARGLRAAYDRGVEMSNGRFGAGRVVAAFSSRRSDHHKRLVGDVVQRQALGGQFRMRDHRSTSNQYSPTYFVRMAS